MNQSFFFVLFSEKNQENGLGNDGINHQVALTTFKLYRPLYCVFSNDPSAHNVCVCSTHENTNFYINGLLALPPFTNFKTVQDLRRALTQKMVCQSDSENCHLRTCEACDSFEMRNFVLEILETNNITHITHKQWITTPRADLITREDVDIETFVDCLAIMLEKFIPHRYILIKQTNFFKNLEIKDGIAVCQWDFAENFNCVYQDATQASYFSQKQVTIQMACLRYHNKDGEVLNKNFAFISDVMKHDAIFVYACKEKLISHIKNNPEFSEIKIIYDKSDNCSGQYKSKKSFINICHHEQDFGIPATWHFLVSMHGKGACDGLGGSLKTRARDEAIRNIRPIRNAQEFFDFFIDLKKNDNHWKNYEFIKITQEDYDNAEKKLEQRFSNLKTIPGTQGFHCFKPKDNTHIYASTYSHLDDKDFDLKKKLFCLKS